MGWSLMLPVEGAKVREEVVRGEIRRGGGVGVGVGVGVGRDIGIGTVIAIGKEIGTGTGTGVEIEIGRDGTEMIVIVEVEIVTGTVIAKETGIETGRDTRNSQKGV